jgi:hypothetical protein
MHSLYALTLSSCGGRAWSSGDTQSHNLESSMDGYKSCYISDLFVDDALLAVLLLYLYSVALRSFITDVYTY